MLEDITFLLFQDYINPNILDAKVRMYKNERMITANAVLTDTGEYLLVDGYHRVKAAQILNLPVFVSIVEYGSIRTIDDLLNYLGEDDIVGTVTLKRTLYCL